MTIRKPRVLATRHFPPDVETRLAASFDARLNPEDKLYDGPALAKATEGFAGITLDRRYNLSAPKGVNGRNSDNTRILQLLGWEPSVSLREGLRKTYDWIESQVRAGVEVH